MDSLIERLEKAFSLLKSKGIIHKQIDLIPYIGKTQSQISDAFNNKPKRLTKGFLTAIADAFPDYINKEYMLTGEGNIEMPSKELRPHFSDLPAAAGFMPESGQNIHEDLREYIPDFGKYSFSVEIKGDSMMPFIQSGDIAYCELLTDKEELKEGRIYIVDTTDGAAIKIISKENKNTLTLHSLNPAFPDYKVNYETILRISRVVAISRKL